METTWHDSFLKDCPARQVLDMLADKWAVLTICALRDGVMRFGELRRRLEGVSQKMLTQTLRELERDGMVARTVYATMPPRVEYSLTELGRGVLVPLAALQQWSERNTEAVQMSRLVFDERAAAAPRPVPAQR